MQNQLRGCRKGDPKAEAGAVTTRLAVAAFEKGRVKPQYPDPRSLIPDP